MVGVKIPSFSVKGSNRMRIYFGRSNEFSLFLLARDIMSVNTIITKSLFINNLASTVMPYYLAYLLAVSMFITTNITM